MKKVVIMFVLEISLFQKNALNCTENILDVLVALILTEIKDIDGMDVISILVGKICI